MSVPSPDDAVRPRAPVFVTGCERSGTTLLGHMLGRHPDCVCLPEAQFIHDLTSRTGAAERRPAAELRDFMVRHPRFRIWGFPAPDLPAAWRGAEITARDAVLWLVESFAAANGKAGATRWVEHSPRSVLMLPRLFDHFPDARALHLVRDGRAVAASSLFLDWGPVDIEEAAQNWTRALAHGHAGTRHLGPERAMTLRYEDLVSAPEDTLEAVLGFLELERAGPDRGGEASPLPAYTREQHRLVGAPPDPSRIESWRERLSPRRIEIFEHLTYDLLRSHGYRPVNQGPVPGPSVLERVAMRGTRSLRRVYQHWQVRRRLARFGSERPAVAPGATDAVKSRQGV